MSDKTLAKVFTDKYQKPHCTVFDFKGVRYDLRKITPAELKQLEDSEWKSLQPIEPSDSGKAQKKSA